MIPDLRALLAGRGTCEHCDKPIQLMGLPDEWWHDDGYVGCDHHDYGTSATPKPPTLEALVAAVLAAGVTVEDFATALGMAKLPGYVSVDAVVDENGIDGTTPRQPIDVFVALPSSDPTKGEQG